MGYIITALFFFGAFCMQQKTVMNFFERSNSTVELHTHSDESFELDELLEIVFTGHVNHTHEHNDHDEDTAHSHQHEHTSHTFASLFDFLPTAFTFNLDNFKSSWPNDSIKHLAKSFQSEILRPPIV